MSILFPSFLHFYLNPSQVLQEATKPMTRFNALAKVGNAEKRKWIYAFTITPAQKMEREELCRQSADVTECPYKEEKVQQKNKKTLDAEALSRGE